MTLSSWLRTSVSCSTTRTLRPRPVRLSIAASRVWPITLGTITEPAPLETTIMSNRLREEFFLDPPRLDPDGCFPVPTGPGLGVTINPEILTRYALDA